MLFKPFAAVAFACLLIGCAKPLGKGGVFTSKCLIPDDQSGTIQGRWAFSPIPVAFKQLAPAAAGGPADASNFSDGELGAVAAAAGTWNVFFGRSKGFPIVDPTNGADLKKITLAAQAAIYSSCNAPIVNASGFAASPQSQGQDSVVVHKVVDSWNRRTGVGGSNEMIAITGMCTFDGLQGLDSEFKYSWIELNFVEFFRTGMQQPDLQTIMTHELGHLIGLHHSCSADGQPGFPQCGTVGAYDAAVMFPSLRFPDGVNGETRRSLKINDQYRANCLY